MIDRPFSRQSIKNPFPSVWKGVFLFVLRPHRDHLDRLETPSERSVSGSKSTFSVAKLLKDNTINEVKDAFEKSF